MNRYLKARIVLLFGSSEDFAEAIEVNSSIISKVIRGRIVLPQRKREAWAKILKCDVDDIFPMPLNADTFRNPCELGKAEGPHAAG